MTFTKTSELLDAFEDELRCCTAPLSLFGRRRAFSGTIATVRCYEDNVLMRRQLEQSGEGRVLVVDGGGSLHRALIGDRIVEMAQRNGWQGLVLNGCLRDAVEIDAMDFAVYALGRVPRRSRKDGWGEVGVPVRFGGVEFAPGAMLYADDDGIAVAARDLQAQPSPRAAAATAC
jgi:regulator of ribonuclease activity A